MWLKNKSMLEIGKYKKDNVGLEKKKTIKILCASACVCSLPTLFLALFTSYCQTISNMRIDEMEWIITKSCDRNGPGY